MSISLFRRRSLNKYPAVLAVILFVLGLTYIFISHDLSVVKFMSDRIVVMNQGKISEIGASEEIYRNPKTDYTRKLIDSIPTGNFL